MDENEQKRIEEEVEISWQMYEKIKKNEACPNCLTTNLMRQGRCITCLECGWSKCDL